MKTQVIVSSIVIMLESPDVCAPTWAIHAVQATALDPRTGRVDAANGGTHCASMSETQWFDPDVNGDGVVDTSDILELIELWLEAAGWGE